MVDRVELIDRAALINDLKDSKSHSLFDSAEARELHDAKIEFAIDVLRDAPVIAGKPIIHCEWDVIKTTTEEIIERLRHCSKDDGCEGCQYRSQKFSNCIDMLMAAAADRFEALEAELAALKERQRWIPVTERLPEENEDGTVNAVLVTDGFLQHMAYFANGDWVFCESGEAKEPMFYEVTHWMPLPEPPQED